MAGSVSSSRATRFLLGAAIAVSAWSIVLAPSCSGELTAAELPPTQGRTNLAAGCPVVYAPAPDYDLTQSGQSDATDLTDGRLTKREDRNLWFDAAAVGWSYGGRVNLAVDLGKAARIDEIAIRLLGGSPQAGINFPVWIEALVSDDGRAFRKVAECSRWNKDDFRRYGVPDDAGKGWIHCLRFTDLGASGRWVGLRIYTTGLSAGDELYVFGSAAAEPHPAAAPGEPSDFRVDGPQPHFHKPGLVVATNLAAPVPIGVTLPAGTKDAAPLEMVLDTPAGFEFLAGKLGEVDIKNVTPETLAGGARRYRVKTSVKESTKTFGRLYVQAPGWRDGQTGLLRYSFASGDWKSPDMELPIRAVEVAATPRLKRILTGLGWWSAADTAEWPKALEAWQTLGLNSFPMFSVWMREGDPVWQLVDEARRRGFFLVNIDSPLHRIVEEGKRHPEVFHQIESGGADGQFCPSYRGEFYQEEIRRFAEVMGRAKPDFASADIEIWGWRGPFESPKCTRCRDDFKASGLPSWEEWKISQGDEMWKDLVKAAREAVAKAGGPKCDIGGYDFRPGPAYQSVWSVDHLYPEWMQSSQVSTYSCLYPYHLQLIGDETRKDRAGLKRSDVLPWLTPGDAGTFPGEALEWALLEGYANGARGHYFWSSRVWDSESLIAYNRAVSAIAPVENVIVDGDLVGDAAGVDPPFRLSGMRRGDEMVLLASDYFGRSDGTCRLRITVPARSEVQDLRTGEIVLNDLAPGEQRLVLPLKNEAARLLHVKPKSP
ncbi:MAG: hypothetical protein HUU20_28085 [Pirellulales bacterium]|nr:hypothetical protein [Pirellulales bacterium]